ncbi:hypothetical protein COH20_008920 [Aspergillus flavus]|nr:uncharacterized protein G4B84_001744 [Aspergillus flavus NRRL3357]KAF7627765.1 hypothetical protein AFLA_003139 [Aspergillus flavus NRRL3357]QMW26499.1 hypothetical protein G4B84_001744 [Aspergillus flavus NRRL3357]RAQ57590.1 hypothetical protein COH21_008222 [Aspergillus flavus]RAQ74252.1 hypothetical protein COH20_008920 [Aspergillus flavus]
MLLISILSILTFLCSAPVSASRVIKSNSLDLCTDNKNFTATFFNVTFTPDDRLLSIGFNGTVAISGNVVADLSLKAYGKEVITKTLDPCQMKEQRLCPMNIGKLEIPAIQTTLPQSVINQVPNVAYTVPDLDASVRVYINSTDTGAPIACMEASLSNSKSVYQQAVGWVIALVIGLGLASSGIASILGYSHAALHVAAKSLALFGFVQSQAILGMTSVHMPPIVESWTQNFQWSMGIMHLGFIQKIANWYLRATGGTSSTLLSDLENTSVNVLKRKRSLDFGAGALMKRESGEGAAPDGSKTIYGIVRVGFKASIERTDIFMTGFIFIMVFIGFTMLIVGLVRLVSGLLAKSGKTDSTKMDSSTWAVTMKGILLRLILMCYPAVCVLCLWEFASHDSPAEVILAVAMLLSTTAILVTAAVRIIRKARRSVEIYKSPAFMLQNDTVFLNKWGFLYAHHRSPAYYFVTLMVVYIFVKGIFVALCQPSSSVQIAALFVIEVLMLVAVCVIRPWMDKKTNIMNISVTSINFLNTLLLLIFNFRERDMATSILGVILFVYNAILTLILLIVIFIASIMALVSKNPDNKYQVMKDDGSSIMSRTHMTELDALGAAARGSPDQNQKQNPFVHNEVPPNHANSLQASDRTSPSHMTGANHSPSSPLDPSVPLFPSSDTRSTSPYESGDHTLSPSEYSPPGVSPVNRGYNVSPIRTPSPHAYRAANNASPWQRGAGYEH